MKQKSSNLEISSYEFMISVDDNARWWKDNARWCKSYHGDCLCIKNRCSCNEATNIDDVDKTMDGINEQTKNMEQIQEDLGTSVRAATDFDEEELEVEFKLVEHLESVTAVPAAPVQYISTSWQNIMLCSR